MINIDANVKFKNRYSIQQVNEATGEIINDLEFHNIVLEKQLFKIFKWIAGGSCINKYGIRIGDGEGTPSGEDTKLFHEVRNFTPNKSLTYNEDEKYIKLTFSYTIPAVDTEIYKITEIGLAFPHNRYYDDDGKIIDYQLLVTHAMLPNKIDKTDLDKIIITCEFYIYVSSSIPNFSIYAIVKTLQNSNIIGLYTMMALTTCVEDEKKYQNWKGYYFSYGIPTPSSYYLTNTNQAYLKTSTSSENKFTVTVDEEAKQLKYEIAPTRMPLSQMPIYFNGITFPGFAHIELPNPSVFPECSLTEVSVGKGDGSTTEFKCPINYFIKDSETIYINGTPQPKNSYTIDNEANQDELIELSAGNEAIISGGSERITDFTLFRRYVCGSYYYSNESEKEPESKTYMANSSNPIFIDFKKKVKLNTFRWATREGGRNTIPFALYGSNNNNDWTLIQSFVYKYDGTDEAFHFNTVEYRYVKITVDNNYSLPAITISDSAYKQNTYDNYGSRISTYVDTVEKCKKTLPFIGYVGEGIKFTTPPPAGAVITMDAKSDLPVITPNNVLDTSATITFQF